MSSMREYTKLQTVTANPPYGVMVLIGAGIIAYGFGLSPWALAAAACYFVYGITGALWIMICMCPYCTYYNTRGCPCGYGMISARLVRKGNCECFIEKFRRHIPVIVPLWLIPPVCVVILLIWSFTWWLFSSLVIFIIISYLILPLVSRKHSCLECPQNDVCPWMLRGTLFHTIIPGRDSDIGS